MSSTSFVADMRAVLFRGLNGRITVAQQVKNAGVAWVFGIMNGHMGNKTLVRNDNEIGRTAADAARVILCPSVCGQARQLIR